MKNSKFNTFSLTIILILAKLYYALISGRIIYEITNSIISEKYSIYNYIISEYFKKGHYKPHPIVGYIFLILFCLLNIYLIVKLLKANLLLKNYRVGSLLNMKQTKNIKSIGSGLIIYAKSWYTLHMISYFFYVDINAFFTALPQFIVFYILGKLMLFISAVAEEGTTYKQENDLTI
ncbi:DUF2975 domain-containing protein [Mesonia sp. K4-1]|uniref:DUF2975 domain-containing protein n=1 Tax=Mesonia sp. K4-1 TaxID=2602760 RepID=UPI0011C8F984|nr:DUF2975 domain-containing protein [Mesonia sp. K4-1]TXK78838.1 DUF2975 domain-containing protein [Mesonia sp. K4-1]